MTLTLLVLALALPPRASADTLYSVDLYGLRSVSETVVRDEISLTPGDPVPASLDAVRARVSAIPGVAEVDVSTVCCGDGGGTILYVGIRETVTPPISFRAPPGGSASLPTEIIEVGAKFEAAFANAIQRGVFDEDGSQGYSLSADSELRIVQEEFIDLAARYPDALGSVLRNSATAEHRALAAQIVAYGPDREAIARELVYAAGDPDEAVRNNATRALALLADWANNNPEEGIAIPADPFLDLLNSVSWTDRNKGVLVLFQLTASRNRALLAELRKRALSPLIEMARWTNPGHALQPFIILARMAGVDDQEAFQAWQTGELDGIIARAETTSP